MSMLHIAGGATEDKLDSSDVFSTYLYTGNGATQNIVNGIDLAGKGGLVWMKDRSGAVNHYLCHNSTTTLYSNTTAAAGGNNATFLANGFIDTRYSASGNTQSSWTFRKAPKFFDIVTYTGNGVAGRQIPHNLGCEVGMMIIKATSTTGAWYVASRKGDGTYYGSANGTGQEFALNSSQSALGIIYDTQINASMFKPLYLAAGKTSGGCNDVGVTYVAYLFAHDPSADGIIQCGSFTTDNNGNATVNLGWEPQFLMAKMSSTSGNWMVNDNMRGMAVNTTGGTNGPNLYPNLSNSESIGNWFSPLSNGFQSNWITPSQTYIYMAIRRPNKVPTSGTEVYNAIARTGTGANSLIVESGISADMAWLNDRGTIDTCTVFDRLRGFNGTKLQTSSAGADSTASTGYGIQEFGNTSYKQGSSDGGWWNTNSALFVDHFFKRAKGFFDIVCYTGNGVAGRTVNHNLGVAPEMIWVKSRSANRDWTVYHESNGNTDYLFINYTYSSQTWSVWNNTSPTDTVFSLGNDVLVNNSGESYITYLFATLAGVSKVGSYTGNGTSQTINCGFSTGARFVLIKRTDSTGDWYIWDTARGIVAANDPHLSLNTTAAEVTTDDSIDPEASGFIVNQNTATNINVNAGTYIFLAIA